MLLILAKIDSSEDLGPEWLLSLQRHLPFPMRNILQKRTLVFPVKVVLNESTINPFPFLPFPLEHDLIVVVLGIKDSSVAVELAIVNVSRVEVTIFCDEVALAILVLGAFLPGSEVDAFVAFVDFDGQILQEDVGEVFLGKFKLFEFSAVFKNFFR